MACRSLLKVFVPKQMREAMARENARLLMQAQSDLGVLAGQMAAGEAGTRAQLEMYQQQQQNDHREAMHIRSDQQRQQLYRPQNGGQGYQPIDQSKADCVIS